MTDRLDLLLVNAPSKLEVYGALSELSAIEPPVWAGLIATYCRNRGFSVAILDAEAEVFSATKTAFEIVRANPRLAVFCVYGHQPSASTQCLPAASETARELKRISQSHIPTLALGTHPSALPEKTLSEEPFDYVCQGEGPRTIETILSMKEWDPGTVPGLWEKNGKHPWKAGTNIENLDTELPQQSWDLLNMEKYKAHNWHLWTGDPQGGYASVQTSLGCTFKCLRGDTLINTMYGAIPIAELARTRKTVPVYTYKNGEVKLADAINIVKTGKNKKLVRVSFDDGSHIDCTPDHRFLKFRINFPANGEVTEDSVEAQHLVPGDRLRAIRIDVSTFNRRTVGWKRSGKYNARMVMEYLIGRDLTDEERVHHKDRNTLNDDPSNLLLCSSDLDHFRNHHPEISNRMKSNNPMHNQKIARKVGRTNKKNHALGIFIPFMCTEKGRKVISRIARKRALTDNPMKRPEIAMAPALRRKRSRRMKALWAQDREKALAFLGRDKNINHRVVSVRTLPKTEDVYCMEVPGYGWFFANNVLVKNCQFCCINAPFGGNTMRFWSPGNVARQIAYLYEAYGITNFKIPDEMFCLNRNHVKEICRLLLDIGDKLNLWAYARVDTVKDEEMLDLLRKAGFRWLGIGIESASKHVRNGVEKGRFGNEQIIESVRRVQSHGIAVAANYIFGLPDDTQETIQETLNLACEINAEMANFYCAMAYPGSPLHSIAKQKGWRLPEDGKDVGWIGYSQHSYESMPLPTDTLTYQQVLDFRDEAWMKYFSHTEYRQMILSKFGQHAFLEVDKMIKYGKPHRKHREHATV